MIEHDIEGSSHLARVSYDPSTERLEVTFKNGAAYRYRQVPPTEYQAFLDAPSKGQWHATRLRGKYPHERVPHDPA